MRQVRLDGVATHQELFGDLRVGEPAADLVDDGALGGGEARSADGGPVRVCRDCAIKAVQSHLGHGSAALTLDVYGHLMPSDDDRSRVAIVAAFSAAEESLRSDGAPAAR